MRCVIRAVLAHDECGDFSSHAAEAEAIGIDDVPVLLDLTSFVECCLSHRAVLVALGCLECTACAVCCVRTVLNARLG